MVVEFVSGQVGGQVGGQVVYIGCGVTWMHGMNSRGLLQSFAKLSESAAKLCKAERGWCKPLQSWYKVQARSSVIVDGIGQEMACLAGCINGTAWQYVGVYVW